METSTPVSAPESPQASPTPQSLQSMLKETDLTGNSIVYAFKDKVRMLHVGSPSTASNATTVSSPGIPPPPPAPPTTPQGGIVVGSNGIPVPPPPPPPAPPLPGQPSSSQMQLRRVNWEKLQTDKLDGTIWRQVSV